MARFDGFVLLAEMRTGSNFLEETLNLCPGIDCHGEAFNPGFVGQHNRQELFGMDRKARDSDPLELMRRIFTRSAGLGGFRLFHDHDPVVLDAVLSDPRIAKLHLTRNPLDAYVSRKIASVTGQWRLTDETHRKSRTIRFDPREFEAMLVDQKRHQARLRQALQVSGQTAFEIGYGQTGDVEIVNGMLRFLGLRHRLAAVSNRLKRQNPGPLSEKVENFVEMQDALAGMALDVVIGAEESEPHHAANVQGFLAAPAHPLLYLPLKGGPVAAVERWFAALDPQAGPPLRGFDRKSLRRWKNRNKDSRSFTIVSHPVERAHSVFERCILACASGSFSAIRAHLVREAGLPIPDGPVPEDFPPGQRRAAFLGYLDFVKRNLSGRTALRSDPAFSSQSDLLRSLGEVLAPDMVIRSGQAPLAFRQLGAQVGLADAPEAPDMALPASDKLAEIHDESVEAAVRAVYNRDYMAFGFRRWAG